MTKETQQSIMNLDFLKLCLVYDIKRYLAVEPHVLLEKQVEALCT